MKAHAIPRLLLAVALLALLTACAHRNPLATWERSPNFDDRRPVLVVLRWQKIAQNAFWPARKTTRINNQDHHLARRL